MSSIPSPVRAALGLAVTVLDEARRLPDKAIELPMLAVSRALQLSLRAQQRYSAMTARGDELLAGRQVTDEPPAWASFDDPVEPVAPTRKAAPTRAAGAPRPSATRKPVNAPRGAKQSAFDAIGDDA